METDNIYHVYRCQKCNSVVTKLQVLDFFSGKVARACPCGSGSISPTNPVGIEWLLPRVLKLLFFLWLGKVAPAPESTRPVAVPPMRANVPTEGGATPTNDNA